MVGTSGDKKLRNLLLRSGPPSAAHRWQQLIKHVSLLPPLAALVSSSRAKARRTRFVRRRSSLGPLVHYVRPRCNCWCAPQLLRDRTV